MSGLVARSVWLTAAAMGCLSILFPGRALAGALAVSGTVELACEIGGSPGSALPAGTVDLGRTISQPGVRIDVEGSLTIRCNTAGATAYVALDYGQHASGSQRQMSGPAGFLVPYELRMGTATAPIWDDQPHPIAVPDVGVQQVPVYALMRSLPDAAPDGLFTDVIGATIYF